MQEVPELATADSALARAGRTAASLNALRRIMRPLAERTCSPLDRGRADIRLMAAGRDLLVPAPPRIDGSRAGLLFDETTVDS